MIEVHHTAPRPRLSEAVLFPFDDHSIPFTAGLRPHLVTCPLQADGPARIYANLDGLGPHRELVVEVLDEQFRSLPGYAGDACLPLKEPGLRQPVLWKDRGVIQDLHSPFRLQATFRGVRPEDV